MEVNFQTLIQHNYEFLRDNIDPVDLADYLLFTERTITSSQYESIVEKTRKEGTEECLNILKNSRSAFNSFMKFLKLDDARGFILEKLKKEDPAAMTMCVGETRYQDAMYWQRKKEDRKDDMYWQMRQDMYDELKSRNEMYLRAKAEEVAKKEREETHRRLREELMQNQKRQDKYDEQTRQNEMYWRRREEEKCTIM